MSSLLRPFVLESCQTTLRGRRRSSHRIATVPYLSADAVSNGSAILDELVPLENIESIEFPNSARPNPPALSPLRVAHVSHYTTSTAIDRHNAPSQLPTPSPTETSSTGVPQSPIYITASSKSDTENHTSSDSLLQGLRWRIFSGFFAYFLCGWGDGVTGTVLPYFTSDFHLTPMTSSLLFTGSTFGFFAGTLVIEQVMQFLGRCSARRPTASLMPYVSCICRTSHEKPTSIRYSASQARHLVLVISSIMHAGFFIMVGVRGGYPATLTAYALAAFARAFLTASLNAYFASGPRQSLGYALGFWSFGGVVAPIVCQAIISSGMPWPRFYFGSLVLSAINATFLYVTFKPTARENALEFRESTEEFTKIWSPPSSPASQDEKSLQDTFTPASRRPNNLRLALSLPYLWAFSIFSMLHYGSETSTQGFMVTYLLATREANPKTVGYVTSGFWGGNTIGRFAWGYFVPRLSFTGRKYTVLVCLVTLLIMHILIWVIDSNIQNAVSASVAGALYGPLFPATLRLANDILPLETHMISMGLISSFASLGAALFPFITGVISSIKGMQTLTYITVPLAVVLVGLWSLFPTRLPTRSSGE